MDLGIPPLELRESNLLNPTIRLATCMFGYVYVRTSGCLATYMCARVHAVRIELYVHIYVYGHTHYVEGA